jgi:hypothetical protein
VNTKVASFEQKVVVLIANEQTTTNCLITGHVLHNFLITVVRPEINNDLQGNVLTFRNYQK